VPAALLLNQELTPTVKLVWTLGRRYAGFLINGAPHFGTTEQATDQQTRDMGVGRDLRPANARLHNGESYRGLAFFMSTFLTHLNI
jgi:hypothetical protein